jgi:hypothetical protein
MIPVNALQSEKHWLPMLSILAGRMISVKATHPQKQSAGRQWRGESGENETDTSAEQLWKQLTPSDATGAGMSNDLNFAHARKAASPIDESLELHPNLTSQMPWRFRKAACRTVSISSGMSTSESGPK